MGRKKANQFLAEGESVAIEAVQKGANITHLVISSSYYENDFKEDLFQGTALVTVLDDKIFQSCSTTNSPKGILCVIEKESHSLDSILKHKNPLISVAVK